MSINDELIWQSLNGHFCSFKAKVQRNNFCRNEQNVTGLCNKSACPLANSRYATIRELDGRCYLMIKTIERAHLPNRLWQKIKLPRNYTVSRPRGRVGQSSEGVAAVAADATRIVRRGGSQRRAPRGLSAPRPFGRWTTSRRRRRRRRPRSRK